MVKADNLVVRYDGLGILVWASGLGDGVGGGAGHLLYSHSCDGFF